MVRQRAEADARTNGCYLNPDQNFLNDLLSGIKTNEERYGYPSCPCRLATGKLELDADVICPCAYRDIDVIEYGCCYCALYVRKDVFEGKVEARSIPERRPTKLQTRAYGSEAAENDERKIEAHSQEKTETPRPFEQPLEIERRGWFCRQCGYVSFREDPPYVCPICKARREMFARLTAADLKP